METMLLSFYTLLGRLYYPPPNYALIFLKKEKKKKLGFSLNSFSVPGLISCVRVNVFRSVFLLLLFSVVWFYLLPSGPILTALWCRKKQKQKNKKSKKKKKKKKSRDMPPLPFALLLFLDRKSVV